MPLSSTRPAPPRSPFPAARCCWWPTSPAKGPDLIVEGPNGEEVIVRDYFTMENPPALQTEGGAQLTSDLVSRMAGTAAPQQFASDGSIQQAQPIGAIETLQGTVTAIRADGSRVTLQQGDQVYQGDVIETGAEAGHRHDVRRWHDILAW